jgi:hypothetical protein
LPLSHSPAAPHVRPFGLSDWHEPPLQYGVPDAQCASSVHVV